MISDIRATKNFTAPARTNSASAASNTPQAPADQAQLGTASHNEIDLAQVLKATASEAAHLEESGKLAPHVEGEVIVKLKPGVGGLGEFAEDYDSKVVSDLTSPRVGVEQAGGETLQIKLPFGMSTAQGIAAMSHDPRVEYAVTNDLLHTMGNAQPQPPAQQPPAQQPPAQPPTQNIPNDLNPQLWGMNNTGQTGGTNDVDIDAPEAWTVTTGKNQAAGGALIAVIDTGVDYTHPDLAANIWTNPGEIAGDGIDNDGNGVIDDVHGYNAINNSGDPMDDNAHGSHCSGTIGGKGNNGEGVVGVQWDANIMGVKFLSGSGGGTLADAIKGINYATQMGARVTSNSWGGGGYNQALKDAIANSPALHIYAAGNESNNNDARASYPASYDLDNIVSVAATDHNDRLASFSNYGATTVDLAAPGVNILSSTPGGGYESFSGTSMATPHVSGAVGLLLSQYPELTNEQIKARLMSSVDHVAGLEGKVASAGRLNVNNLLENDDIAPDGPNCFRACSRKAGEAWIGFYASGDDGMIGKASSYDVRVSDQPIVDGEAGEGQASFSSAKSVAVGSPEDPGTYQRFQVKMPLSGEAKTYHFAIKVADNVGNKSEIRTASVTVPAATVAFEDNFESDSGNFAGEGWSKVQVEGRGNVWTDSAEGQYEKDANRSLVSRAIDLTNMTNSTLVFDAKVDTEARYDKVHVEVAELPSEGQEARWSELASYDGKSDWATRELDMSAFDGKQVQVRFRLTSDGSVQSDGFYLDNVVIAGAGQ